MNAAARALALGVLLLAINLPAGVAFGAPAESAEAVLVRTVHARATAAYRGEQIVTNWQGSGTQVTVGRIEHDPPGWTRLEYRAVGSSRQWVVLRRDADEIHYDPKALAGTRTTRVIGDDDAFLTSHLPWLLSNYELTVSPGNVLGRRTDRLVLRPRRPDRPTRRLDIDTESGVPLLAEREGPDGRLLQVTAFLWFEVMPRGWRTNATLPPGLRLTDRAPVRRITPEQARMTFGSVPVRIVVPAGFQRVADYVVQDHVPALETIYSDGLSVLLVSSQRGTIARPPAGSRVVNGATGPLWVRRAGQQTLVHWAFDGWLLTMVGDLRPDVLVQAAEHTGVARAPRVLDHLQARLRSLLSLF